MLRSLGDPGAQHGLRRLRGSRASEPRGPSPVLEGGPGETPGHTLPSMAPVHGPRMRPPVAGEHPISAGRGVLVPPQAYLPRGENRLLQEVTGDLSGPHHMTSLSINPVGFQLSRNRSMPEFNTKITKQNESNARSWLGDRQRPNATVRRPRGGLGQLHLSQV